MDLQEASSRILAEASPRLPRREREDAIDRIDGWIDRQVRKGDDFGRQDLDILFRYPGKGKSIPSV